MSEDQNLEQFINTSAQSQEGGKSISDYKNKESKERHYYGDALNDDNVNDIVDEVIPHVVVLVGFPEYGKSTFVASFYHALLTTGKIGKYYWCNIFKLNFDTPFVNKGFRAFFDFLI